MNNPQFAMGDLNKDGLQDMVVYEKQFTEVKTFLNYGTPGNPIYHYRPQYEKNFPLCGVFIKLVDYNCDKIPDLIEGIQCQLNVYRGYYNAQQELCFDFYKILRFPNQKKEGQSFEQTLFPLNFYKNMASSATVQPEWQLLHTTLKDNQQAIIQPLGRAAPFIYDIDKDGKPDLLIGRQDGFLSFYKNTGAAGQLQLIHQTDSLGMARVDASSFDPSAVPFMDPMDNSGK